ncbi:S8 family peptidase [Halobaculum sp. MBLA0147]|uniref:S8 family peptidase n=1 Tax=Halobaculum sp. MBLA0147 TaxID=3079934 RepID=UPI0035254146
MSDSDVSRRGALRTIGAAAGAAGVSGLASANPGEKVEVNVGFANDAGARAFRRKSDEVVREFDFDAGTARMPKAAADGLENNPNVRYVEENGTMQALGETEPYGIDRVDADVTRTNGDTGNGADIAIIDTGIDADHPDLQANLGSGKSFVDCSTKGGCRYGAKPADNTCKATWDDDNNHGTHCAGTADAVDNTEGVVGVATEATLHAVKVLGKCGSGSFSDIAAGIEYTANQGWDVASMSLGGSSGSSALKDAVQYAASEGVFLVAAAGNSGPCTDCVGYPAAYSEVVAVGATDSSDTLANFSSTGPEVELAAPGVDVLSTITGDYKKYSGTSMACPHVAGAAGILMANGKTASEVRSTLTSTAEDVGLASNESGNGLLDAAAAAGLDSSDST